MNYYFSCIFIQSNPLLNSNDDKDDSDSVTEDELTEEEKAVLAKVSIF